MPLTALQIKAFKPAEKDYKKSDDGGLYILIRPNGTKLWRMNYVFAGKQKTLSIGSYDLFGLAAAREARDDARRLLAQGIDPAADKARRKVSEAEKTTDAGDDRPTVRIFADGLLARKQREGKSGKTISKTRWLFGLIGDNILDAKIQDVTSKGMLDRLRVFEAMGKLETANRMRTLLGEIWRYAAAEYDVRFDAVANLRGGIAQPDPKHHPAITDRKRLSGLFRAIDQYNGEPQVHYAVRISPHIVLRSSEIRRLEWSHVDFERSMITVPGNIMKMKGQHLVPMSHQVVDLFKMMRSFSGRGRFCFPGVRNPSRVISENTLNAALAALAAMGYSGDEMVHHGFRTIFSTYLNEAHVIDEDHPAGIRRLWEHDWIEAQLAHSDKDKVRSAYNAAEYIQPRIRMMQWYSDLIDKIRSEV